MQYSAVKTNYVDDSVARDYDRARFSSLAGRVFDTLEKRALRRVLAIVRREIPFPRALDVPCGTGRITRLWLDEGLTVTGGDVSAAMIRVAQQNCAPYSDRASFEQMDLDGPVGPVGAYDVVSCIRLFHHLDTADRGAILLRLAEATRRFVIVNYSLSSPYYRARRSLKRWLRQGVSRTSATWSEINQEVLQAGLRIVRVSFLARLLSENIVLLLERHVK